MNRCLSKSKILRFPRFPGRISDYLGRSLVGTTSRLSSIRRELQSSALLRCQLRSLNPPRDDLSDYFFSFTFLLAKYIPASLEHFFFCLQKNLSLWVSASALLSSFVALKLRSSAIILLESEIRSFFEGAAVIFFPFPFPLPLAAGENGPFFSDLRGERLA